MKALHKSKGITLIALVVTIIVLLILAGVSINMISGGNGILSKAVKAVDETKRSSAQEEVELAWITCTSGFYMDYESSLSKNDYFKANLQNCVSGKGKVIDALTSDSSKKTEINIPGTSYIAYEYDKSEYYFEIDENGGIKNTEVANSGNNKRPIDPEWSEDGDNEGEDNNPEITPDPDEERIPESELNNYPEISPTDSDDDGITNYKISYVENLVQLSENVANGKTYKGKTITLTRKLDIADRNYYKDPDKTVQEYGFSCLNETTSVSIFASLNENKNFNDIGDNTNTFKGTFNGNKYGIENLVIEENGESSSLFCSLTDATVKNLKLKNCSFNSRIAGVFVYKVLGNTTIKNCKSIDNTIDSVESASGLAYMVDENATLTIKKCYNDSNISGANGSIGGLVYISDGTLKIYNSYNLGKIENNNIGGIVGESKNNLIMNNVFNKGQLDGKGPIGGLVLKANNSEISNCYNEGELKGYMIGGLIQTSTGNLNISNSYNKASVINNSAVGGILNEASGSVTIKDSYNAGNIEASNMNAGIIRQFNGDYIKLENTYNTGNIKSSYRSAGICSYLTNKNSDSIIYKCYNTGNISSVSGSDAGGLIAYSESVNVDECYNTGEIYGYSSNIGGIVGYNRGETYGNITNCYNTGKISTDSSHVGGIVGNCFNTCMIKNCHNTAEINSNCGVVGGIVGYGYEKIENCYNTGKIISGSSKAGGIIGGASGCDYILNSYNTGDIVADSTYSIGGIAGEGATKVYNTFNVGKVNGNYKVGGITGYMVGDISNCFNYGVITAREQDPTLYSAINGYSDIENVNNYYLYGTAQYGKWQSSSETVYYPDEVGQVESKTATQFKDGTVLNLLNKYIDDNPTTTTGWMKWKQGDNYPVLDL